MNNLKRLERTIELYQYWKSVLVNEAEEISPEHRGKVLDLILDCHDQANELIKDIAEDEKK